jgi:hypothetical protein
MNRCVRSKTGLDQIYSDLKTEGRNVESHGDHVTEFHPVFGLRGQVGVGDNVEVGHVFSPANNRPDVCGLCGGPKTASVPDEE